LAVDVYPKDVPIPPGEEWYYELDGRTHGPLSRGDLEELLSRCGETASDIRVRQGKDGAWSPFRPGGQRSSSSAPTAPTAPAIAPTRSPPSHRPAFPKSASGLGTLYSRHRDILAAVGAWILLNVVLLIFGLLWQPSSRERRYLQTLLEIEAEVQDLRAKPTSDAEWKEFRDKARAALDPIVSDLKKSANPTEPARQQLLWSARDLVPHTLGPRSRERDEYDRRLKQYLDTAQHELEGH
jgi:hypothetical protein